MVKGRGGRDPSTTKVMRGLSWLFQEQGEAIDEFKHDRSQLDLYFKKSAPGVGGWEWAEVKAIIRKVS